MNGFLVTMTFEILALVDPCTSRFFPPIDQKMENFPAFSTLIWFLNFE